MLYQRKSPWISELSHTCIYDHMPNVGINSSIRMSPSVRPIQKHMSPFNSMSVSMVPSIATGPRTPSPMSLYDYQSLLRTPSKSSPETRSLQMEQETIAPPLSLEDKPVNTCYFLGQLQGSYYVETRIGPERVNVIVPRGRQGWKQYAIVRRICSSTDTLLPEQFIYEEATRFLLCSFCGNVKAVLMKGSNMKHSVRWEDVYNGSLSIWWRKENVSFNSVRVDSLKSSRRDSLCSAGSSSVVSSWVNTPGLGVSTSHVDIQPELLQQSYSPQIKPELEKAPSNVNLASNNDFQRNFQNLDGNSQSATGDYEQQAMFELIKAHCMGNTKLRQKMAQWVARKRSAPRASPREISNITRGRLWITAHWDGLEEGEEIEEDLQESLNDIKGAYKQVKAGLYKQPEPQGKDPGVQHRLRKEPHGDPFGYWKIEAYEVDSGNWKLCAKELPDGRWIDMRTSILIRVLIVPMSIILHKMGEEYVNGDQHVAKSIEFLFTSCNQKRLNSKLNRKNLRHNINNIKVRLKRQHALTFAVQVASAADAIAKDLDAVE